MPTPVPVASTDENVGIPPFAEDFSVDVGRLKERLGLRQLVSKSVAFAATVQRLPQIARHDVAVLLTGETGTGKELCARAIHYLSQRASRQFVAVNCGALPAELVENELFGHTAGAYTGATRGAEGLVVEAEGGTLFFDEVDSLPLPAQVKLLRLLQEKEFRPVGARQVRRADVRVLAAANCDLHQAMRDGKFRADLFYRLNVMPLPLPPLRERREDLPELVAHFLLRYAAEFGTAVCRISRAALLKLDTYSWPGNVRELENVIQRAVLLARGEQIEALDVQFDQTGPAEATSSNGVSGTPVTLRNLKAQAVAEFERRYIADLLRTHHGNITHAARAAGKHRRAFWQLMRKHGMARNGVG